MRKIRNNILQKCYKQLTMKNIEINTQKSILNLYMNEYQPQRNHQSDLRWLYKTQNVYEQKLQKTHDKKLNNLKREKEETIKNKSHNMKTRKKQTKNDNNNVVNLANVHLNVELLNVLGKGLKFVPTPQTINVIEFISNTEKGLSEAPTLTKQTAINEILTFVNTWKKPKKNNLTKAERSIINKVKKQTNVMFIPADKGGKVVVIN